MYGTCFKFNCMSYFTYDRSFILHIQREDAELQQLEEEKAAEEKRRQQKAEKDRLDESLKMKRAAQMKQEQEELAFDRKILEQVLEQSKAEQVHQAQRKVSHY